MARRRAWSVIGQLEALAAKRLCILVDQFEELFRFAKETSREEAELFVDLLTRTITPEDEGETSASPRRRRPCRRHHAL